MLVPVIFFPGTCAEAHKLYQKAFDMAVKEVVYNKDVPEDYLDEPLNDENQYLVVHSECNIRGIRINMSDAGDTLKADGMVHFNVFVSSDDEVRKIFDDLKEGAEVESEPQTVFWSSLHCSLRDRFGVNWQIMTE